MTLQDSVDVVCRRFSDGVEVTKCVVEFCKVRSFCGHVSIIHVRATGFVIGGAASSLFQEMASVERSYSVSIHKLLNSTAYTFHSNILMKWLGSEPYEEIGYTFQVL